MVSEIKDIISDVLSFQYKWLSKTLYTQKRKATIEARVPLLKKKGKPTV